MTWYNVGDIIECNSGERALILSVEKMYRHPDSPPHSFEVQWLDKAPVWDRPGKPVPMCAVKKVVARA